MWFDPAALYEYLTVTMPRRVRVARRRKARARRRELRARVEVAWERTLVPEVAAERPPTPGAEREGPPAAPPAERGARAPGHRTVWWMVLLGLVIVAGVFVFLELRTSWLQARYLARVAAEMTYHVEEGPSPAIRFPATGPYDERLGYTRLQELTRRLAGQGWVVARQARMSRSMLSALGLGLFPPYPEKTQAGLEILDRHRAPLFLARYPERVYRSFAEIPPLVWKTLLYIENRELLDPGRPYRNPAVEWDRLARAGFEMALAALGLERDVPGASTLATQIEKFRHSPEGRTAAPREKLRQMASAALRSYMDGPRTLEAQRRIVLDYLNSVPLAAIRGYGEVIGLGDGLWAWYGADFAEVNRLLREEADGDPAALRAKALAYRRVLGLLLAERRPSYYLMQPEGRRALDEQADRYLTLLAGAGLIPGRLAREAKAVEVGLRERAAAEVRAPYVERKAANDVRVHLLGLLDVPRLYELDRLDLTVETTYDRRVQEAATAILRRLRDPQEVQALGLVGPRMLGQGDPSRVIYSITLFERTPEGNLVRVQADNFEGPLSVNYGTKLDLGSTAKLRTLVNYLEIVEELYHRYSGRSPEELRSLRLSPSDRLSRWAVDYLIRNPGGPLTDMLDAALTRRYPASPAEAFFTGGGLHRFENFDETYDGQELTVLEGFRHSVNLVFIRLMRDIVHYYMFQVPGSTARALEDVGDPRRAEYLARFADQEGRQFLGRFYRKYREKPRDQILEGLVKDRRLSPQRLARVFRYVRPGAGLGEFAGFLERWAANLTLTERAVRELYHRSAPGDLSLPDMGFLAGIHPLELWLVRYLLEHPDATLPEIMGASTEVRQEVYGWLFRTSRKGVQDRRIRAILEMEAFEEIHRAWRRLGYPFEALVPSYATAIGSSADRPVALAELVGILLNDGVRYPTVSVRRLHFAAGTPYETELRRVPEPAQRVLSAEVAAVARRALMDVVERGTARRAYGAIRLPDGTPVVVGGKTGTGDNRYKIFAPGGRLVESTAVHRTSTFVFFIGDRLFGAITAYVPGPEAAQYTFTSSLPTQILTILGPALAPLLEGGTEG